MVPITFILFPSRSIISFQNPPPTSPPSLSHSLSQYKTPNTSIRKSPQHWQQLIQVEYKCGIQIQKKNDIYHRRLLLKLDKRIGGTIYWPFQSHRTRVNTSVLGKLLLACSWWNFSFREYCSVLVDSCWEVVVPLISCIYQLLIMGSLPILPLRHSNTYALDDNAPPHPFTTLPTYLALWLTWPINRMLPSLSQSLLYARVLKRNWNFSKPLVREFSLTS